MALYYPDNLEHNNPNNPLMDVNQLRGSYNINLLSERDLIPLNKRSLTQNVSCRETERIYIYIGTTVDDIDWTNSSNWKSSAADAGGNYLPISGGTLTGLLSGTTISATDYSGITSTMVTNLSNLTGDTVTDVLNYLPIYTKSDTPPLNPRVDDVWLDTNTDRIPIEYIWFTDDNGESFWVNWGDNGIVLGGISTGGTITTSGVTNIYYANSYQEFVTIIATIPVDVASATIYANLGTYKLIDYTLTAHTHTLNIIATSELSLQGTWYMVKDTIGAVHMYIDGIISLGAETNNAILGDGINLYIKSFKNTNFQDQLVDGDFFYNTKDTNIDTPNGYRRDIWLPSLEFNSLGNTAHTHTISEITNLQSSLDNYLPLSGGTLTGSLTGTTFYGDGSNLTGIESGGFQVINVSGDTLCQNNTIYFVDTVPSGVTILMTLPQATTENFQVRIYKYSSIDSKDVYITSTSPINDLAFQIVQGEDEGLWIVSDGTDYHIVEDNRGIVQTKLSRSSGAITPCAVTKNIDNTINLGAFIYFIEDSSNLKAPISKAVKFAGVSNYVINNLGTCGTTIIYIDADQNLTQLTNVVTPDTHWSNPIRVAIAVHTQGNGTVDFVFPFLMPAQNPGARLSAFQTAVGCVKSGIGLSCTPASLQLITGSGTMFIPGVQSVSYPLSPDSSEIAAHNPLTTISYYTRSSRLANKTLFDPTSYNPSSTTVSVIPSNNNAVIHHVYCDILGQISIQYGQTVYASLTAAISAHLEGQDSFNENPIFNSLAVKIGYIIATKACTSLTDSASSKIIGTDKFGSTGGGQASASVVDLQRAYDNSVQPQITTSTTKGALQIKNGAVSNITDAFEIQNISGVKVFGVNGLGLTTDSVSATTYSGITTSMVANTSTLSGNTVTDVFNNATVSTDGIVLYTTDMIAGVREEVINGTTVQVNKFWSGTLFTKPKLFTVFDKDTPLATDDYNIFVPDTNITITKVYFKTKATTVTFNINHSSNVDIWTADKQATTTLQLSDVINNPNCLAGMPIKYQASAIGATPTNIHVTIYYTEG
jgi:hypothetical protein